MQALDSCLMQTLSDGVATVMAPYFTHIGIFPPQGAPSAAAQPPQVSSIFVTIFNLQIMTYNTPIRSNEIN